MVGKKRGRVLVCGQGGGGKGSPKGTSPIGLKNQRKVGKARFTLARGCYKGITHAEREIDKEGSAPKRVSTPNGKKKGKHWGDKFGGGQKKKVEKKAIKKKG